MYRPLFALLPALLAMAVQAALAPQDHALADLHDPTLRTEIGSLGGYPEMLRTFGPSTLHEVPLTTASATVLEFREAGLRVRIESLPFDKAAWVEKRQGTWMLEDMELLGWSPGQAHDRLSRVEVVLDGVVVTLPVAAWADLFDAPLRHDGLPYACVMRSQDGWRTYIHVQVGEGPDARLVTWVIDDGRYLFRVVDPAP